MKRARDVTWFALRAVYDEMLLWSGVGFLWFVLSVVLPYGCFRLVSAFVPVPALAVPLVLASLIPMPPATAALYHMAHHIARGEQARFEQFGEGFRDYLGISWKISALLLASGAILVVDITFYLRAKQSVFPFIGFLALWVLAFWLVVQIYLFPLMVSQEDRSLKQILKNASLLTLAYPLFSLGMVIVILVVTALSVLLLFVLVATVWMPFVALLNSRALISSLEQVEQYRQRKAELDEEERGEE